MDIMDLAMKGIVAITKNFGKKVCKNETAPEIEKVAPEVISGSGYRAGFSTDEIMPDLSVTSDVIVGFPGETYEEFKDTISLLEKVRFTSLFTFIFSPRPGTKAYDMADEVPAEEKSRWFKELTSFQEKIAGERTAKMKGKTYKVLVEGKSKTEGLLSGRTEGNVIIEFMGDESLIGTFATVKVTNPKTWVVYGEYLG